MTNKPRIRTNADGSYRLDAWQNAVSGMGMPGVDKSIYSSMAFAGSTIGRHALAQAYRFDWLSRKVCDRPARDAVRRWIVLDDLDILADLERLHAKRKFRTAISWARLFGGAAVLIIVDDGRTAADPLDPAKVTRVVDLKVVDRWNLTPTGVVDDPYDISYQEPEYYQTNNGTTFHHSRVMKFYGTGLTQDEQQREQFWGGSYVELYQEAVRQFQGTMQDTRHILTESSISVLKIPGLTNATAHGGTIVDALRARMDEFATGKGLYRTAALDDAESHEFQSRQLTGLSDIADRFMTQVAGATDMTSLVLFGTSPSGLNASQEEQMAVYYDMVGGIQEEDLTYAINRAISCLTAGQAPDWEFKPLMTPTEKQQAETRNQEAQALAAIADYVMLTPEESRTHLNETGSFDFPVPEDYEPEG